MPLRRARKSIRDTLLATDVADRTARYGAAHILLVSQPVFAIALGLALWFSRGPINHSPTFAVALVVMPLLAWVVLFCLLGVVTAYCLTHSLRSCQTATLVLSIVYAAWAVLLGLGTTRGGIGTGVIAYLALSTMASAASAACRKARP